MGKFLSLPVKIKNKLLAIVGERTENLGKPISCLSPPIGQNYALYNEGLII